MNWQQPIVWLADVMRPHNSEIALAMVATLLVIFGDHINRGLKYLVRKQPNTNIVQFFTESKRSGICSGGYGQFFSVGNISGAFPEIIINEKTIEISI